MSYWSIIEVELSKSVFLCKIKNQYAIMEYELSC